MSSKYTSTELLQSSMHYFKVEGTVDDAIRHLVDGWTQLVGEMPDITVAKNALTFRAALLFGVEAIRKFSSTGSTIVLADGNVFPAIHDYSQENLLSTLASHHFKPKNDDYGDAFERFGTRGIMIRMDDKVLRMKSLMQNQGQAKVRSESMIDTVVDFTVYAMMALMLLKRRDDFVAKDGKPADSGDDELPF